MATSTNFGWTEPNDTDLVKNGASAMRTLGNAIDSTLYTISGGIAGKNKIINGDFGVWQRGTSFSALASDVYFADRFITNWVAGTGSNVFSQQTFTPGTAPVSGYEGSFFARASATSANASTQIGIAQKIENVRTFAGQTVTLSFWAKGDSARTLSFYVEQNFGVGGSASVSISVPSTTISTSWTRYTATFAIPSISGKTIGGNNNHLNITIYYPPGGASGSPILDIWGVQLEAGSTASPFQTATGTKQGELAACQRYYAKSYSAAVAPRTSTNEGLIFMPSPNVANATNIANIKLPQTMRTQPTVTIYSYTSSTAGAVSNGGGTDLAANSGSVQWIGETSFNVFNNSGGSITAGNGGFACHYVASAEL